MALPFPWNWSPLPLTIPFGKRREGGREGAAVKSCIGIRWCRRLDPWSAKRRKRRRRHWRSENIGDKDFPSVFFARKEEKSGCKVHKRVVHGASWHSSRRNWGIWRFFSRTFWCSLSFHSLKEEFFSVLKMFCRWTPSTRQDNICIFQQWLTSDMKRICHLASSFASQHLMIAFFPFLQQQQWLSGGGGGWLPRWRAGFKKVLQKLFA